MSNPFDYSDKDKNIYLMSSLDDLGHVEETKQYSTDISDAWQVVEKLALDGFMFKAYGSTGEYRSDGVEYYVTFEIGR